LRRREPREPRKSEFPHSTYQAGSRNQAEHVYLLEQGLSSAATVTTRKENLQRNPATVTERILSQRHRRDSGQQFVSCI
jgi:hypothetical protein